MQPHVSFQVCSMPKRLVTHGALIWLFTCVCSGVPFQSRTGSKFSLAIGTLEGLFPRMDSLVISESRRICKLLPAVAAAVRLLTCVNSRVLFVDTVSSHCSPCSHSARPFSHIFSRSRVNQAETFESQWPSSQRYLIEPTGFRWLKDCICYRVIFRVSGSGLTFIWVDRNPEPPRLTILKKILIINHTLTMIHYTSRSLSRE